MNSPIYLKFTLVNVFSSALFSFLSKIPGTLTSRPACSSSAVALEISQPQNSCIPPGTPLWSIPCPSCRKTCIAPRSQVRPSEGSGHAEDVRSKSLFIFILHLLGSFYLFRALSEHFFYMTSFNPHIYPKKKVTSNTYYKKLRLGYLTHPDIPVKNSWGTAVSGLGCLRLSRPSLSLASWSPAVCPCSRHLQFCPRQKKWG